MRVPPPNGAAESIQCRDGIGSANGMNKAKAKTMESGKPLKKQSYGGEHPCLLAVR